MTKLAIFTIVAFAFSMAAVAQTGTDSSQGTPGSYPSPSQPSQQQPGMPSTQPQPDSTAGQTNPPTSPAEKSGKEKKLKGCVQSQGGQYVLESKKGKTVALSGQDVSAHVGHEVSLKGTWETGGAAVGASTAGGTASDKTFNVSNVEMVSENCGDKSSTGNSGNMGTSPTPAPTTPNPDATGSTTSPPKQ